MTPQTAILPDHCLAGIFIQADILAADTVQAACTQSLAALSALQNRFPGQSLGLTIAFGADFWRSLNRPGEAAELKNFVPLGGGLAPATQHDLLIHIQSMRADLNYALAQQVLSAFGSGIRIADETHGFRHLEERGWDGFVDGTENPQDEKIAATALIAKGADAGGSYVLLQKYRHNLQQWRAYSQEAREEAMARSEAENVEFDKSRRHPRSHIARTNLKENGVGLKIVRRSLPYGTVSGENGLMFIAYCATLYNLHAQLLSMFGDSADGQTDLLLERLSTAVSGGYYFAPPVERLHNLQAA